MPITAAQFKQWRGEARADFNEPVGSNQRAAHCRLCKAPLPAGTGRGYIELMSDFYRGSTRYVCAACEEATRP